MKTYDNICAPLCISVIITFYAPISVFVEFSHNNIRGCFQEIASREGYSCKLLGEASRLIYNISVPHVSQTFSPLLCRHTILQRERLIQAFDLDADLSSCHFRHIVSLGLIPQVELISSILVPFLGYQTCI